MPPTYDDIIDSLNMRDVLTLEETVGTWMFREDSMPTSPALVNVHK